MAEAYAIELYKLFRQEKNKSIELHLQTFRHFLAILIALLAATIAGATSLYDKPSAAAIILFVGGVLGIFISYIGRKATDRFSDGTATAIMSLARLESIIDVKPSIAEQEALAHVSHLTDIMPERFGKIAQIASEGTEEELEKAIKDPLEREGFVAYTRQVFFGFLVLDSILILASPVLLL